MENKTEMGLLLLVIGIVLSIFSTLGATAANALGGSNLSPGAIIPCLLSFFMIILLPVGWFLMITGRKEFGEKHAQFVGLSIIVIFISIIVAIVGGIMSILGSLAGGLGQNQTQTDMVIDWADFAMGMSNAVIITEMGGIILTIGAIMLVYNLENELGKRILFLALIASIVIAIGSAMYLSPYYRELSNRLEGMPEEMQEQEFLEGSREASVINSLDVIGMVLLVIAYLIPYNRIKKGELKPTPLMPYPYGMPPYPTPYPYQPYPPYGGPYPPEYHPPGEVSEEVPERGKPEPREEEAGPEPSPDEAAKPEAVTPVAVETKKCQFCGEQIPIESVSCPLCKGELETKKEEK